MPGDSIIDTEKIDVIIPFEHTWTVDMFKSDVPIDIIYKDNTYTVFPNRYIDTIDAVYGKIYYTSSYPIHYDINLIYLLAKFSYMITRDNGIDCITLYNITLSGTNIKVIKKESVHDERDSSDRSDTDDCGYESPDSIS